MIFFRTDSRKPEELLADGGFNAWQKLTGLHAINILRKFCGNQDDLYLPPVVKSNVNSLKTEKQKYNKETRKNEGTGVFYPLNMIDLSRLIKAQKTRDSFWISTDYTEDCGGYNSTFKYKINFDDIEKVKINSSIIGSSTPINPKSKPFVFIDTGKNTVAVELKGLAGGEVSFLTSIPTRNIIEFKPTSASYKIPDSWIKSKNKGWYRMPHRKAPPRPSTKPWLNNNQ